MSLANFYGGMIFNLMAILHSSF